MVPYTKPASAYTGAAPTVGAIRSRRGLAAPDRQRESRDTGTIKPDRSLSPFLCPHPIGQPRPAPTGSDVGAGAGIVPTTRVPVEPAFPRGGSRGRAFAAEVRL